jgi:nucleolar complex protein 2
MERVDSWCAGVENDKIGSIRSILQAFRQACHYGEDQGDNSAPKFSVMSGSVLDKVMHFVLRHMDRVLRKLLGAPSFGGKKETITELMLSKTWKRHGNLMRIYLANALHMITEMTDEKMIAFTIHRVRASAVFLAAFPSLLRKYVKVRSLCFRSAYAVAFGIASGVHIHSLSITFACFNYRLCFIPGLEDEVQCLLFLLCSSETCAFS